MPERHPLREISDRPAPSLAARREGAGFLRSGGASLITPEFLRPKVQNPTGVSILLHAPIEFPARGECSNRLGSLVAASDLGCRTRPIVSVRAAEGLRVGKTEGAEHRDCIGADGLPMGQIV